MDERRVGDGISRSQKEAGVREKGTEMSWLADLLIRRRERRDVPVLGEWFLTVSSPRLKVREDG